MRIFTFIILVTSLLFSSQSMAQTCNTVEISIDAPNSRYLMNVNGTLTDKKTSLIWKRCLEGQSWNGVTCQGIPGLLKWQGALSTAVNAGFAGQSDWRLPNQKELQSLVERACFSPSINLVAFPNTSGGWTWSSTPVAGQISAGSVGSTWLVDFEQGRSVSDDRNVSHFVRLVRGGQ